MGLTAVLLKVCLIYEALISGSQWCLHLSGSIHCEICEKLKLDMEDTRNQPQVGPLKDCNAQGLQNIIIVYIILAPRFLLANLKFPW
jgi:hypothetical protein